jgi:RND family efflux transporter MFP subunit
MNRLKGLIEAKAISQKDYDDAVSNNAVAQAALHQAQLNLSWTTVTAPVAGTTGRAAKSEGNLISVGADSLLTSIYQSNPIWVRFSLGDSDLGKLAGGRVTEKNITGVEMILANGTVYPKTGKLNFLASNIDTTLGTQQLRAEFDNKENQLLPGQFVRIRLLTGERDGVFLVPQAAIIQTEQGPIVMLAGAEDKVAPRPIQVAEWRGKDWVVTGGLKAGDKVIVDNLMKLRPGAPGCTAPAGRSRCRACGQAGSEGVSDEYVEIFYQPADFRVGHFHHHRHRRAGGLAGAADCAIPANRPADRADHRHYPGASAETLAKTVAAPIEEQLNGVENLLYFTSSAAANGVLTITATFDVGTNVDTASVNVNNRVKAAEARLPEEVRRNGVIVQKRSNDILQVVALESDKGRYNTLFLSNYASLNIADELKRIKGVGDVTIFGAQDYSMRVWLKPDRMAQLGLTTSDVAPPSGRKMPRMRPAKLARNRRRADQMLVYTVTAKGRLLTPEEFGNIVIRASGPGGMLRLKDIANIELGAYSYDQQVTLDGQPTIAMGVFLQTGANALEVAELVRGKMETLKKKFPEGMGYVIPFDTTLFVSASISEVVKTLIEAMLLVLAVVYHLPAKLARHADPDDRRADFADRHLCRPVDFRLLDQYADAVCDGAGDRYRRR